jgi:Na+/H+ antiporter NhaA
MSLFIVNSAFHQPNLFALAKINILLASVLTAVIGFVLIVVASPGQADISRLRATPETISP